MFRFCQDSIVQILQKNRIIILFLTYQSDNYLFQGQENDNDILHLRSKCKSGEPELYP